jgi:glycosyltransferase 2 family protein
MRDVPSALCNTSESKPEKLLNGLSLVNPSIVNRSGQEERTEMMTPTRHSHSKLGLLVNAGLAALAFGLLGLVIWKNSEKIHEVFSHRLDLGLLAAAEAIYLLGMGATFVRWFILVRVIEPRFTLRATLLLGLIGNVFNLVIPGAVGGDLIKGAYLVRMHIKKTQAIASMVIDRILGLLGLFILASIAGGLAWPLAPDIVRRLIMVAWVATALGVLVLMVIFGHVNTRTFPRLGAGQSRLDLIVAELREMSTTYRRRLGIVFSCTALSVAIQSLNVWAFYLVGRMLFPSEMKTTLGEHFLMVPLTLFTMVVPLPFGALGLTEGVGDHLFKLVGHPSGFLAMMGFRVLMYGCAFIGACVYLAKLKEVRALTASAHELEEDMVESELDEADTENSDETGIQEEVRSA